MSFTVQSLVITCYKSDCGISFAVPEWWHKGKRETHTTFYCPNGHGQHFSSESEAERLRRERDIARQQIARVEQERIDALATANAQKDRADKAEAATKRLKRRVAAGTCPCCQRTFTNMARHMKTKHPNVVQLAQKAG